MKKSLFSLAMLLLANISFSQVFFSDTLGNTFANDTTLGLGFEIPYYFRINNPQSSDQTYVITVIDINLPHHDSTNFEVCIPGMCVPVDTIQQVGNEFVVSDYETIDVNYITYGYSGDASITIKATNRNNSNDTAILSFDTQLYAGIKDRIINNSQIKIFPNPATDILNISISDNSEKTIQVVDMTGKTLKQTKANNFNIINISDLERGVYFIKAGNNYSKFIKK